MIIDKTNSLNIFIFLCLTAFGLGVSPLSRAADQESGWQVSVGLGAGVRTNPVMDNDDIPLLVIPQISYQGEEFFVQNLDVGYTLFQDKERQFNLLLTPGYDQVFFNRWDVNNFIDRSSFASIAKDSVKDGPAGGVVDTELSNSTIDKRRLHKRRMAALAGLEYNHTLYELDLQVQVLQEITDYYGGNEIRFSLSKNIHLGKNDVKLTLGANWQNASTLNYFYGLTEQESLVHIAYRPGGGLTSLLRFDWNYQLNEHWSLRFFSSYRHLSHAASDSPLVVKNNVVTAFAGGVYHF